MIRIFLSLVFAVVAEYYAFYVYRSHPLVRPPYFQTLCLVVQMAMCYGGIEAARWLLRHSPAAKAEGIESDWAKLWIWMGPPGGALLTLACLLGYVANQVSESRLAGPLVVAHISGGALCWLIGGFWAVPLAFGDPQMTLREKALAFAGMFLNTLGFATFYAVYPAQTLPPVAIVASALFFFFLLFYAGACTLVWAFIFRFWKPAPAPKALPKPETTTEAE